MSHLPRRISKPGPILEYCQEILKAEQNNPKLKGTYNKIVSAVKTVASTPEGAMLLELLDKATHDYRMSPDTDPRALDALNAQSFIASDLRRIASDEMDQLLERQKNMGTRR